MNLLRKKQQRQGRRTAHSQKKGRAVATDTAARYAFRRNRTLTGSLSSGVQSASEHNSELRSARVQTHHLHKHRRHLSLALLGVVCVLAVLSWLIWQSVASVKIEVVDGASSPAEPKPYVNEISGYLSSHPFERSRVTINMNNLTAYVRDHGMPEVDHITLSTEHERIGEAIMLISMRKPVVSWKTGATRLYVDASGIAFQRNYYPDPAVEVVDDTGIQAVNNQVLASNRFLGFIGLVIGHLHSQGYGVSKVTLPAETAHQILVSIEGAPYPIKFSTDRSAAEQVEDAARSMRYLSAKGIVPDYLDVRVSGRAYYR